MKTKTEAPKSSELIREVAAKLGKDARPADIIATLKKDHKRTVSYSAVSSAMKKVKVKRTGRRTLAKQSNNGAPSAKPPKPPKFTVSEISSAGEFINFVGGLNRAMDLLSALDTTIGL